MERYVGIMLYYGHYCFESIRDDDTHDGLINIMEYGNTIEQCLYDSLVKMYNICDGHFPECCEDYTLFSKMKENASKNKHTISKYHNSGSYSAKTFGLMIQNIMSSNHEMIDVPHIFSLIVNHDYIKHVVHFLNPQNDASLLILKIPNDKSVLNVFINYEQQYCHSLLHEIKISFSTSYEDAETIAKQHLMTYNNSYKSDKLKSWDNDRITGFTSDNGDFCDTSGSYIIKLS